MDIQIRGYVPGDLNGVTEIWNAVIRGGMAFPAEDEMSPREAADYFGSMSACGVAVHGDRVVGVYILRPNGFGRRGHVCNAAYAVDPGMAGKGIGSMLIDDSMGKAKDLGFRIMQFNAVVQDNASAIHLYQKKGFSRIGAVPGGFRSADGEYRTVVLFYHEL